MNTVAILIVVVLLLGAVIYRPVKLMIKYRQWANEHPDEAAKLEAEEAKALATTKAIKSEIAKALKEDRW